MTTRTRRSSLFLLAAEANEMKGAHARAACRTCGMPVRAAFTVRGRFVGAARGVPFRGWTFRWSHVLDARAVSQTNDRDRNHFCVRSCTAEAAACG